MAEQHQRTGVSLVITTADVVAHLRAVAKMPSCQLRLDALLALEQPIHRCIRLVDVGIGQSELLGQCRGLPHGNTAGDTMNRKPLGNNRLAHPRAKTRGELRVKWASAMRPAQPRPTGLGGYARGHRDPYWRTGPNRVSQGPGGSSRAHRKERAASLKESRARRARNDCPPCVSPPERPLTAQHAHPRRSRHAVPRALPTSSPARSQTTMPASSLATIRRTGATNPLSGTARRASELPLRQRRPHPSAACSPTMRGSSQPSTAHRQTAKAPQPANAPAAAASCD